MAKYIYIFIYQIVHQDRKYFSPSLDLLSLLLTFYHHIYLTNSLTECRCDLTISFMLLINNKSKEKRGKKFLSHMSFVFGHFSCLPKKSFSKNKKKLKKLKKRRSFHAIYVHIGKFTVRCGTTLHKNVKAHNKTA